jgi:dihydrolipoamide dehydrogenase
MKTACVEMRGRLGGTCLNVGCIPSKALLQSSHHYHDAKHHFADHGIVFDGELSMDVDKMQDTKSKTVEGLTGGIEYLLKKYGVDYVKGKGKITGPNGVEVALIDGGSESLDTKNIIIATGSEVTPLPPVPVDNAGGKVVDSTGALEIGTIPKKMAVVGGGVIGLEMGSVWSRLGAEVTVIEFLDRILPTNDIEVAKKFQTILKKQGFKFNLKTKVVKSVVEDDGVVLTTEPSKGGDTKEEKFDVVLVSTGRRPYTEGLGLEDVGIQTDKLGRVEVDAHFKTAVPSIFAIGDAISGPMLAHKAEEEGIACVETIAGFAGHVCYDAIPGK